MNWWMDVSREDWARVQRVEELRMRLEDGRAELEALAEEARIQDELRRVDALSQSRTPLESIPTLRN